MSPSKSKLSPFFSGGLWLIVIGLLSPLLRWGIIRIGAVISGREVRPTGLFDLVLPIASAGLLIWLWERRRASRAPERVASLPYDRWSTTLIRVGAAVAALGAILALLAGAEQNLAEGVGYATLGLALLLLGLLIRLARRPRRPALLGLALLLLHTAGTCEAPLRPVPGLRRLHELARLPVRDGIVNPAGGNLLVLASDLDLETRLGTQTIGRAFNSATGKWVWSFDQSYVDGVFQDAVGTLLDIGGLPAGPIAGTPFTKVDGSTLETRGGLRYVFGGAGRLIRIHWRHASYPRLEYLRPDPVTLRIVQCTTSSACTDVFTVSRGAQGLPTLVVDRAGRRVEYGYSQGRLATVRTQHDIDELLPGTRYTYATATGGTALMGLLVTNSENEANFYGLDDQGRTVSVQQLGEGDPILYGLRYQTGPYRTVVTDPLGRETVYTFDASRRLLSLRRVALQETTSLEWVGERVSKITGPDGLATTMTWGVNDEIASFRTPWGRVVSFEYPAAAVNLSDPASLPPSRVYDVLGDLASRTFDPSGRVATQKNGAGEEFVYGYGALETLASVRLPDGRLVEFLDYGDHGFPLKIKSGEREDVRVFDAVGNLVRGVDPSSATGTQQPGIVAREFDGARNVSRLAMAKNASGVPLDIAIRYRSDGQIAAVTRPYGANSEWIYDGLGRLEERRERVDGAWETTRFEYTRLGELRRITRANQMQQEYEYDAAGRRTHVTNRRGGVFESDVRYAFENGRLITATDSTRTAPTRYAYDFAGRVSRVIWPGNESTTYTYSLRGEVSALSLWRPDGSLLRTLRFGHDGLGREVQVDDGAARIYENRYVGGRLDQILLGNGITRTLSYDEFGRPSGVTSRNAANQVIETETVVRRGRYLNGTIGPNGPFRDTLVAYSATTSFGPVSSYEAVTGYYVPDGQRWIENFSADTHSVGFCDSPGCESHAEETDEFYSLSGLMDISWIALDRVSHGSGSETTTRTVFERNPEHNRLHRVLHRTEFSHPWPCPCPTDVTDEVVHSYSWDEAGFATSRDGVPIEWNAIGQMTRFGANTFAYDAEGRLRSSTVAGVTRTRLFGGSVEGDANGNPMKLDLRAVQIDLQSGTRIYRHFDYRGNVKSVSNDAGVIVAVNHYAPYGRTQTDGDASDDRSFAQGQGIGDLVLIGARVYDQAARQFLSPDPIYSLVHQFTYAQGDPTNFWDPSGLESAAILAYQAFGYVGAAAGAASGYVLGSVLGFGPWGTAFAQFLLVPPLAKLGQFMGHAAFTILYYLVTGDWFYPFNCDYMGADCDKVEGGSAEVSTPLGAIPAMSGHHWQNPTTVCAGGECMFFFGPPPRFSPPPAGGRGGSAGSAGGFSFAAPSVGFGCGLLGIEPVAALLLARAASSLRRRRPA